jgi:hypothetical protein
MQPYIPQALVTARIAEMHREADSERQARELKRARRLAGRVLAPVRPLRVAATAARPERAALAPPAERAHAGRPAA